MPLRASRTANSRPPSATDPRSQNSTVAGSRIGFLNVTCTANAAGSRDSSAARQRAFVHIPCAIAVGNPNSRAVRGCTWIGFRSPDTEP